MAIWMLFAVLFKNPDLLQLLFYLALVLLSILLLIKLGRPVPEGARERWTLRALLTAIGVCKWLAHKAAMLRICSEMQASRWIFSRFYYYSNLDWLDWSVQATDDEFETVKVRLYRPRGTSAQKDVLPGIVYYHGGGWVTLDIAVYDAYVRKLCRKTKAVVCIVEPRQAPEHTFPEPFFDSVEAAVYFMKNAKEYGVDPNRVALAGDSCGGHMALAVAMSLATQQVVRDLPHLKALALLYPATQGVNFQLPSYRLNDDTSGKSTLDSRTMIGFWALYGLGDDGHLPLFLDNRHTTDEFKRSEIGQYCQEQNLPERFRMGVWPFARLTREEEAFAKRFEITLRNPEYSPLSASHQELSSLPPTYVMTAEFDPLRDDGFLLVKRLENTRVTCEHRHYDDICHGFLLWSWFSLTKESISETADFLTRQLSK